MRPFFLIALRLAAVLAGLAGFAAAASAQAITSGQVGVAYSFTITTNPAAPAGSIYAVTNLPTGLSVNAATGVISGTPTVPGTATGTISVTSGGATNNYNYSLTITPASGTPVITSGLSATGTVGTAFTYTITASGTPTSYNVGPAPGGLSYNDSIATPQITGTPTTAGTYMVSLSANNGNGAGASVTLTLTINPAGPVPAITSATSASTPVNTAFSYTITASNTPTSFSASGLPLGLTLNAGTGAITGTPTVTGVYTVALEASNGNGAGATTNLTLTVGALPVITSATSLSATVNQSSNFTLTATNSPVSFNLSGLPPGLSVNTASGVISGAPTATGNFTLSASANNAAGTGPTATLTLTVAASSGGGGGGGGGGVSPVAPIITTQPNSQSVPAGGSVTFTVAAAGTGTLTYQWSLSGAPLSGATNASLTLTNVQPINAGSYSVAVTNAVGTTTSTAAILSVISAVTITTQPASQTVKAGTSVTFSVVAAGATTYQWQFNGAAISGATGSSYTIAAASAANSGSYTVVVTNANGSTTSTGAVLAVQATGAPAVSTQPQSQTMASGATVVFAVTSSGTVTISSTAGEEPTAQAATAATYQWYWNGIAIAGATQSTLLLQNVSTANAGTYSCLITNAAGSTLSNAAVLAVTPTGNPGRLINLSILSNIQGSLTMGFVNGGGAGAAEPVLVRGVGPAIGAGTVFNVPNVMIDPSLTLVQQNNRATVAADSGWGTPASNVALIQAADAATGSFALTNSASLDSAVVATLPVVTGGYSATISGKSGDNGWALTEVYDDTPTYTTASTRLINLSCLTQIAAGGTLDVGFVVGGSTSKTVLVRVAGPALNALYGIGGIMADPQLQVSALGSAGTVLAADAAWGGTAQLVAIAGSVGAYTWPSASSLDSAVLVTLAPGPYTVQVNSVSGAGGTVLVEIYDVP